jgi:hypothetical protein
MSRPRPVVVYAAVMAGLAAVLGFGGLADLIPAVAIAWLTLATAVISAVGGVLVQGVVTPLSDPRDAEGRRLLPSGPPPRR